MKVVPNAAAMMQAAAAERSRSNNQVWSGDDFRPFIFLAAPAAG